MNERYKCKPETHLNVEIEHTEAGVNVKFSLTEKAWQILEQTAQNRGLTVGDMLAESIRLERLLADRKLLYAKKHWWGQDYPRELLSV